MTTELIFFPPFRLDLAGERLWRDDKPIPLRPKTFAVLRYLAEQRGRLVTNDELLRTVWSGVVVSETMPRLCIREIRRALDDDAKQPRIIETVHRRGYRFIRKVVSSQYPVVRRKKAEARSQESEARSFSFLSQHSALCPGRSRGGTCATTRVAREGAERTTPDCFCDG